MKLFYKGEPAYHPATGLELVPGEHEYPPEHVEALTRLGLTEPPSEPAAKSRKAAATKEE